MKLFYHMDRHGNFGDDLNAWLWSEFLPNGFFDDDDAEVFIGMGSLLGDGLQNSTRNALRRIVMGTGSGYRPPVRLDSTWDVRFVRGPRTAARFSLDAKLAITDPGILVSRFQAPAQAAKLVSYMPHHSSLHFGDWEEICVLAGLNFIDPRWEGRKVMSSIGSSRLLLTEALHGAIAADSLRVPWIPIRAYAAILEFKWLDWAESMELEIEFCDLPPIYRSSLDYPIGDQVKNVVKNIMSSLNMRRFDIVRPMIGSSEARKLMVAELLIDISEQGLTFLSDDRIFAMRLEQVLNEVQRLAAEAT